MNINQQTNTAMKLEKKIHAVNEVNRITKIILDNVLAQLEKYIGQKIFLVNGDKASKFIINYPTVELSKFEGKDYAQLHRCYVRKSYKSIYLSISGCFQRNETGCFYEEQEIWLGDLDDSGQILKSLRTEPFELKDYNANEVRRLLKEKEAIEKQLDEVKSKVRIFLDAHYD